MSALMLPRTPNPQRAEEVYRRAKEMGEHPERYGTQLRAGLRIARAKEPLFVLALERLAETLDAMAEEQSGHTRRQSREIRENWAGTRLPSVVQVFREAFVSVDSGKPVDPFAYLYAAVAEFAGFIVG